MFYFKFSGFSDKNCRLGNQLSQIAATVGHARYFKKDFRLEPWKHEHYFQFKGVEHYDPMDKVYDAALYEQDYHWYTCWYDQHQEVFWSPLEKEILIDGYFIHNGYYRHCEDEIRDAVLAFNPDFKASVQANFEFPKEACALHVRRTDYLNITHYFYILPLNYYVHAMNTVYNKTGCRDFVIFSDDIPRCKKLFESVAQLYPHYKLHYSEGRDQFQDLCAMTLLPYHIMGNSTYSHWGSYLAKSQYTVVPPLWHDYKNITQEQVVQAYSAHRPEAHVLYEHQDEISFQALINRIRCESGMKEEIF